MLKALGGRASAHDRGAAIPAKPPRLRASLSCAVVGRAQGVSLQSPLKLRGLADSWSLTLHPAAHSKFADNQSTGGRLEYVNLLSERVVCYELVLTN